MGLFSNLFGKDNSARGVVEGTLSGIGQAATGIRSAITGELPPETRAELEKVAQEIERSVLTAQAEINKTEAEHPNLFVAGWRPGLAWTFVFVIALHYLFRPLLLWASLLWLNDPLELPAFDVSEIWPVLLGLLGLGGYRTVEKFGRVQDRH